MTPRAQVRLLNRLEREHGPSVRKAFEKAMDGFRSRVDIRGLERAIAAGDIAAAAAAIGLAPPLFRDFEAEVSRAFEQAGRAFTDMFPKRLKDPTGLRIQFSFDIRHHQAERWLQAHSSELVTRLIDTQRDALREHLADALRRGISPRQAAIEIAGRLNRATGRRQGGILGLDGERAGYVRRAREELLSGDPTRLRRYLGRKTIDRSLNHHVRRALRSGEPIPLKVVDQLTGRYADKLLKVRADAVAQTETLTALRSGKHEAFRQGVETVGGNDQDVQRIWDSSGDGKVRETHNAADGQIVIGIDTPFMVGGYQLRFPGDSSLGAPASETVRCRCQEIHRVDFIGILQRRELLAA